MTYCGVMIPRAPAQGEEKENEKECNLEIGSWGRRHVTGRCGLWWGRRSC